MNGLRGGRRLLGALMLAWPLLGLAQSPPQPEGRTYAPGRFDRIELAGIAQVRLTQGERDQVFVVGDSQVQDSVDVSLSGNRLVIRPQGGWKFWTGPRLQVDIQVRRLHQLVLSGASDLIAQGPVQTDQLLINISGSGLARFDDLQAERLSFVISGAGEGRLRGRVRELQLSVSGKGKLGAGDLRAERALVTVSGVAHATLWATEALRVQASGVGMVEYWGQPEVQRSASGIARLTPLGNKPGEAP